MGPLNLGDPDGFVILARYAVGGAGRQPVKIQAVPFGPPYRAMLLPDPRGRMRKYAIREVVFEWDGRDIAGNDVPSGTYPYTLRARLLDEGFGKPRFLAVAPPVAGEITVAND